jgi:acetyl-CoA carboxylase biotin carboxyl carrier protein
MPLTDADVREILRLIDESPDLRELRVETGGLSLHVLRGDAPEKPQPETEAGVGPGSDPELGPAASTDGVVTVAAPMLGTFYRAEAPGAAPFVDVGTQVEPDTVVCLIEVMKMMNSVPAGVAGTVVEVVAANAEPVEHGQPLFLVKVG